MIRRSVLVCRSWLRSLSGMLPLLRKGRSSLLPSLPPCLEVITQCAQLLAKAFEHLGGLFLQLDCTILKLLQQRLPLLVGRQDILAQFLHRLKPSSPESPSGYACLLAAPSAAQAGVRGQSEEPRLLCLATVASGAY